MVNDKWLIVNFEKGEASGNHKSYVSSRPIGTAQHDKHNHASAKS